MAVSIVTSGKSLQDNGGTNPSVALSGLQSGDCIVAGCVIEGTQTVTFSDGVNSYTTPTSFAHAGNDQRTSLSYALNCAAGSPTVTGTLSAQQYCAMFVVVLRNVKTSSAEEDIDVSSGTGDLTPIAPTVTATGTGIVVAVFGTPGNTSIVEDGGWTLIDKNEDNNYNTGSMIYQLTTPGNYTAGWTINGTNDYVVVAVILGEAAAGTSAIRRRGRLMTGVG